MGASESTNSNQVAQMLEEEFSNKINNEVKEIENNNALNKIFVEKFFNSFIKEEYRGDMFDFFRIYKLKLNQKKRKEFIYDIFSVENKYTKTLYNMKVYRNDLNVFGKIQYEELQIEKNLLINDIIAMQEINTSYSQNLVMTYLYIKNDNFFFLMINTYSTEITLLDKMNEKIQKSLKFTELEIDMIMRFLFEILDKMRYSNCIHRGLTPSAIYFGEKDNYSSLILRDYFFSSIGSNFKGLTGSLWYSAPEVLKDSEQDFKVDIYSAGVILYQAITLENPYQNNNSKENLLKTIDQNVIEKSFHRFIKINYQSKYFEIILKMTSPNKYTRCSLDELISDKTVKEIRLNLIKANLLNKNLIFNLKTNYLILDEMIIKLKKMNKDLLGLIYYWLYNMCSSIIDRKQMLILNSLFDFFDTNKNNSLTTSEFREKIFEYHLSYVVNNDNNYSESIKVYSNKYKSIIELIHENSYVKSLDFNQINFQHFCTIILIMSFFDDKERRKRISNDKLGENKSSVNSEKTLNNSNPKFMNKSMKTQNKIYGDFDIRNVECLQETNENKLYAVFNYYLKTDSFFEFRKLISIEKINRFPQIESMLENHYERLPLLIKDSDGINHLSKENFMNMLELEFEGPQ